MIDLERLKSVQVDQLENDDVDYWCTKLLEFSPNINETKRNLLTLFNFTCSLLSLKLNQNDVLVEELKTLGKRFDTLGEDIENIKKIPSENEAELEDALHEEQIQRKIIEERLKYKENENSILKIEIEKLKYLQKNNKNKNEIIDNKKNFKHDDDDDNDEYDVNNDNNRHNHDDHHDDNEENQKQTREIAEKNAEIEQLLDRVYEIDRQNLDLAESLAKIKLENVKYINQEKIHLSRIDLLELEVKEFKKLNETLFEERYEKNCEIDELKKKLDNIFHNNNINDIKKNKNNELIELENESNLEPEKRSSLLIRESLYNELKLEIERLTVLLEAKESQLERAKFMFEITNEINIKTELKQKQLEIENLEEELSILNSVNDNDNENFSQKQNAQILRLKKDKQILLIKIAELEKEADIKDEELEYFRRKQNGETSIKNLLEENVVLGKMIKTRDEKISYLIEQLNKNTKNYTNEQNEINLNNITESKNLDLQDKLTSLAVERDLLDRQISSLGTHLESVQKENFQLEAGLREILESLRNSDTTSDVIIECPSLEKLCSLMENRLISSGLNSGTEIAEYGKIILLKTELDNVRGQNEQLRAEMKHLRNDFLSVIDGYTSDILENWTLASNENFIENSNVSQNDKNEEKEKEKEKEEEEEEEGETLEQVSEIQTTTSNNANNNEQNMDDINLEILKKLKSLQIKQYSQRKRSRRKLVLNKINRKKNNFYNSKLKEEENKMEERENEKVKRFIKIIDQETQTDDNDKEIIRIDEKFKENTNDEIEEKSFRLEMNKHELDKLKEKLIDKENELINLKKCLESSFVKKNDKNEKEKKEEKDKIDETNERDETEKNQHENELKKIKHMKFERKDEQTQTYRIETHSLSIQVSFDEKNDDNNKKEINEEDEEYVEMINNFTQTDREPSPRNFIKKTIEYKTFGTQTNNFQENTQIRIEKECSNCFKHVQLFQKVKNLIQNERQQFNQLNIKSQEHIDKLKQTLTVTKREYDYDVQSKNNIIEDLRRKLKQNNYQNIESKMNSTINYSKNILNNDHIDDQYSQNSMALIQVKQDKNSHKDMSKTILETSISCLRNCLKQKEDALEEYRKLIENMRVSVQKNDSNIFNQNLQVALTKNEARENKFGKNLQELMLKPYVQQNEELNSLIQKTFQELRIVRESNAKQQHSMKVELESKSKILIELTKKHQADCKEKESLKEQIKKGLEREKTLVNKVEKLNARIIELSKRYSKNQQEFENRSNIAKKKVENSVFQESADLRFQNIELQNRIKKIEIERWTLEKKFEQDKQLWRHTLEEKDREICTNSEQLSKLQNLIGKLEKQLRNSKKSSALECLPKPIQSSKCIQTEAVQKSVRFKENHKTETTSENDNKELLRQYEILTEELQKQLEASLKREKFSTIIKEIQAVGENIIETTTIEKISPSFSQGTKQIEHNDQNNCLVIQNENNKRTNVLKPNEIYDQLIDMQFDRLISENTHLKVQLKLKDDNEMLNLLHN